MHSLLLCGSVMGTAMTSLPQTDTEGMAWSHFLPTSSFQQLLKLSHL